MKDAFSLIAIAPDQFIAMVEGRRWSLRRVGAAITAQCGFEPMHMTQVPDALRKAAVEHFARVEMRKNRFDGPSSKPLPRGRS